MERSWADSTSSKTNCRWHCGHSKTSGNTAICLAPDCAIDPAVCRGIHLLTPGFCAVYHPRPFSLGDRSMVGQAALNRSIGVRLPVSQPSATFLHFASASYGDLIVTVRLSR